MNQTGTVLKEIEQSAKSTAQLINEIATASMEQKQGINQINNAIAEMDNMTQQNAALVEETASASEEMSNQAQDLLEMVKQFTISDTTQNEIHGKKHREVHLKSLSGSRVKSNANRNDGNGKDRTVIINDKDGEPTMRDRLKNEGFEEF